MADIKVPPYAEEWLAAEAMSGGRSVVTGSIEEIRAEFNKFFTAMKTLIPPPDDNIKTIHEKTSEGVSIREYTPSNLPDNAPTGLYIHSGGWICGSIIHEDHLARRLAQDVPCRLVSVEYRLAPEHPFPAALEDCLSAWNWIASNSASTNSNLFIVGGSAGGHLTLTTTLALLSSSKPASRLLPTAIFPLCPSICMPQAYPFLPSHLQRFLHPDSIYQDAAAINRSTTSTCGAAYIGDAHSPTDPLISPIFNGHVKSLPPVYVTTSDKDPLNDEAELLRCELERVGVRCEVREYKGYPHFFHAVPGLEGTERFHEDLGRAVRERCC